MSTKQAIIEAAAWLFAEKGYEGMTIKEIAKKVGITPPAVYAFFKNKEDVFFHIYKEVLNTHLQVATYHAEQFQHMTAIQQLEQLLREIIDFQYKESFQIKIFMRLLLFPPDIFETDLKAKLCEVEEKERDMFCQIFEKGIKNGEIKEGDSRVYATSFLCMMDGLFWEMQRYDEATFRERFEMIWEHFWQGIKK